MHVLDGTRGLKECCVLACVACQFVYSNSSVSLVTTFGDEDGIDATSFTSWVTSTPHDSF